jgi:capsular exopolysaccharide synthesis family protein
MLLRRSARRQVSHRIVTEPNSAESETVRHVRTAIALAHPSGHTKVLMVTSALPGDGKSTLALMIGRQSAHNGNRVIVVEAEMRRPSFGAELSNIPTKGLADYLLGEAELDEVVAHDPISGMHFIPAGRSTHLASELLGSKRLTDLLATLSSNYDFIVLDTPPVTVVADALHLGRSVDAAVLVVKWGATARHLVLDAAKKLRAGKVPVIGTVMTGVDPARYRRYGRGALAYDYAKSYYIHRE